MTETHQTKSVDEIWTKIRNPDFEHLRTKYPEIIGQYFTNKNEDKSSTPLTDATLSISGTNHQDEQSMEPGLRFVFTKKSNYILTELLAKEYLGLELMLDRTYLCPRLGNRMAYITWLHALLERPDLQSEPRRVVRGLDVGTGASCVYPLIATSLYENWRILGTDISRESIEHARRQLDRNPRLAERVNIKQCKRESDGFFFFINSNRNSEEDDDNWKDLDFVICNPPFYASPKELAEAREQKQGEASTELQARDHELYTDGGEYGFVKSLIDQSLTNHEQQQKYLSKSCWYTAMINKKSNLYKLIEHIKQVHTAPAANYVVHDLDTGSRTQRWTLGWNWGWRRAPYAASHSFTLRHVNPDPVQLIVPITLEAASAATVASSANRDEDTPALLDILAEKLERELEQLDYISLNLLPSLFTMGPGNKTSNAGKVWVLEVKGDVWSRAYRRRQLKRQKTGDNNAHEDSRQGFVETILRIELLQNADGGEAGPKLQVDWVYGREYKVFESFTTMIKRKLEAV
jgi:23S rRNA (adenine1618-N6)-methyltransferase